MKKIDHIIFASPTLEAGVQFIKEKIGVEPVFGGQHLGRGTHNALLALGKTSYLEVIAPDPKQNAAASLWMKTHLATQPQLWTWAAKSDDLFALEKIAQLHAIPFGKIENGSRTQPNGNVLSWQLSLPVLENENGLLPFFLDWKNSIHPSQTLPQAGEIIDFIAHHPEPFFVKNQFEKLGLEMEVIKSNEKYLQLSIRNIRGELVKF